MPTLNPTYVATGGHLVGSDIIWLDPQLTIHNGYLRDAATLAKHQLNPLAETALLPLCQGELSVQSWLKSSRLSKSQIQEITIFLMRISGLRYRRSLQGYIQITALRCVTLFLTGSFSTTPIRSPATFLAITLASAQAILLLTILCLLLGFISFTPLIPLGFTVFYLSVVLHEYAHAHVLRKAHPSIRLIRRGMRLAILHPPLEERVEVQAALIGPLAGCLASIVFSLLLQLPYWLPLLISSLHLTSLLPFYGDGKAIAAALKRSCNEP